MKFISYYTDEYVDDAKRLIESLDRHGLPHAVQRIENFKSWNEAVNYRTRWILGHLLSSRQAVCWLDADCEVVKMPSLLLGASVDFAAYNWSADPEATNGVAYDPTKLTVTGAVLYFAYTAPSIELILRWEQQMKEQPHIVGSDPVLDIAYNVWRPPCTTLWLPKTYGRIKTYWPDVEPVIDHHIKIKRHDQIGGQGE